MLQRLLLAFAAFLLLAGAAQARERLAMMPATPGDGVSRAQAEALERLVVDALHESGRFDVFAREDLTALIGLEQQRQLAGCDSDSCLTEIAGALDAQLLGALSLVKVGDALLASLRVIETRKAKVLARATKQLSGDLAQATNELVRQVLVQYDAERALDPAAAAVPAADSSVPPLPPELSRQSPLANTAGPEALALFTAALEADARGASDPARATSAWEQLSAVSLRNPFYQQAARRSLEWKAFDRRRGEEQQLLVQVLQNPTVDARYKRTRLEEHARRFGEDATVALYREVEPAELRRELCRPLVAQHRGPILLQVNAVDDQNRPALGTLSIDGVSFGTAGGYVRVPTCVSLVEVSDRRTGGLWRHEVRLDPHATSPVGLTARLPGDRWQADGSSVPEPSGRRTWTRHVPQVTHTKAWSVTYCDSAADGGYRLPTREELQATLSTAPDALTFPDAPAGWYWTDDGALLLGSEGSSSGSEPAPSGEAFVRCVRSARRIALRGGLGLLTGGYGVGAEFAVIPGLHLALGSGRDALSAGLSVRRARDGWSPYLDVAAVLGTGAGLLSTSVTGDGLGLGATVGIDLHPVRWLGVKCGVGGLLTPFSERSRGRPAFDLSAGMLF